MLGIFNMIFEYHAPRWHQSELSPSCPSLPKGYSRWLTRSSWLQLRYPKSKSSLADWVSQNGKSSGIWHLSAQPLPFQFTLVKLLAGVKKQFMPRYIVTIDDSRLCHKIRWPSQARMEVKGSIIQYFSQVEMPVMPRCIKFPLSATRKRQSRTLALGREHFLGDRYWRQSLACQTRSKPVIKASRVGGKSFQGQRSRPLKNININTIVKKYHVEIKIFNSRHLPGSQNY